MESGTIAPKKKKASFLILAIGCFAVAALLFMVSVMIPGGPSDLKVSASFNAPLYSDTKIVSINLYNENDTNLVSWTATNDETSPSLALGTIIDTIEIMVAVNITRLAPGGNISDHLRAPVYLSAPDGSNLPYSVDPTIYIVPSGDIQIWRFRYAFLGYDLTQTGMYNIIVDYRIEVP